MGQNKNKNIKKQQKGGVVGYFARKVSEVPAVAKFLNGLDSNTALQTGANVKIAELKSTADIKKAEAKKAEALARVEVAKRSPQNNNPMVQQTQPVNSMPGIVVGTPQTLQQEQVAVAGATKDTSKNVMKNSLNQLYYIIAIVMVIMFFVLFIVSWMDFSYYIKNETNQEKILSANPNIFIDQTYDYELLTYLKNASMTNEVQYIFYEQYLLSIIYNLFTFAAFIIGIQFLMFLGPKFNQLRGLKEDENNKFDIPPIVLVILIVFGLASGLNAFYQQVYLKTVINSLKNLDSAIRDIKKNIFANLINNNDFLNNMVSNNIPAVLTIIQNKINANNGNSSCSVPTSNCDLEVEKMIFTISLYTYFKDTIPDSDPRYNDMLKIFTQSNINTKTIDPTIFFYYKQSVYIENMYDTLKNEKCANGTTLSFTDPARESVFITNLSNIFQTVNKSLIKIQTITEPKKHIRDYILQFAVITTFMFLVLVAIYILILFFPAIIANSRFVIWIKSKFSKSPK